MPNSSAKDRRTQDSEIAVLQVKNEAVVEQIQEVRSSLERHVTECATLQKWVLGVLVFIAGLAVADSPKVLKLVTAIIGAL